MICIYHNEDYDGKCGGAIVKKFFNDYWSPLKKDKNWLSIGMNYNDSLKQNIDNEVVVIVDFSFPVNIMSDIKKRAKEVIWLDHHISAIKQMENANLSLLGKQDITKSGCELAWEFFFPKKKMPKAVELFGRYDVFDLNDERLWFQYGANSYDISINSQIWDDFLSENEDSEKFIEELIDDGKKIERYLKLQNKDAISKYAFTTIFEGLTALCLNTTSKGSLLFESMWDPSKHDCMIKFNWNGKQNKWDVSLYSNNKKNVDVSIIAKRYDGGGHKGAAGFMTKTLPFFTSNE
jgi:oligoribonuclease NrnB/cAMP/cGMP phosphodiesterase (DHH superfamily)